MHMTRSICGRRVRAVCRHALLALCAWLCLTSAAMAHASLTGAVPQDGTVLQAVPETFSLSFSEPVSPLVLSLVKPDGSSVTLPDFALRDKTLTIEAPAALGAGTHVLSWRVVSEDGHPVSGSILFSIGAAGGAQPAVADAVDLQVRGAIWLAKLGLYAGFFFGIGGVFALNVFMRDRSVARTFIGLVIGLGLVSVVASAAFQGLDALGAPLARIADLQVWTAGLGTSFGRTVSVMAAALVLSGFALLSSNAKVSNLVSIVALVGGSLSLALSGHASAADPEWLMRPSVFLHAGSIAIWIGALLPLGLAFRNHATLAGPALLRFSRFIPVVVAVLVVAGTVLAVVQMRHPSAFLNTAYGNLLAAKLVLVAILLLLAAINRWRLTQRAAADDQHYTRYLARTIAAETLLVLLVLGVAAAWRFTPPPRALAIAAAQPASAHIHAAKAMAELTLTPGRAGPVTVSVVIMTDDFRPLHAKEVTFVFSHPTAGIEPIRRGALNTGDGTWRVSDLVLPISGKWTVRLDILISDFELTKIQGTVDLKP
jgi:copper transport protein